MRHLSPQEELLNARGQRLGTRSHDRKQRRGRARRGAGGGREVGCGAPGAAAAAGVFLGRCHCYTWRYRTSCRPALDHPEKTVLLGLAQRGGVGTAVRHRYAAGQSLFPTSKGALRTTATAKTVAAMWKRMTGPPLQSRLHKPQEARHKSSDGSTNDYCCHGGVRRRSPAAAERDHHPPPSADAFKDRHVVQQRWHLPQPPTPREVFTHPGCGAPPRGEVL